MRNLPQSLQDRVQSLENTRSQRMDLSPGSDVKIESDSNTNSTVVVAAMDLIIKL